MTGSVCTFEDCGRPVGNFSRGLCRSHNTQALRGENLRPLTRPGPLVQECSFDGCHRNVKSIGLCGTHYIQKRKGNELTPIRGVYRPIEDRFMERVDSSGECWLWKGHVTNSGYGSIALSGAPSNYAHRISYWLKTGETPEIVDHICWNKLCVNPEHLQASTKVLNGQNRAPNNSHAAKSASGVRNVIRHTSKSSPWKVVLTVEGSPVYGGSFPDIESAEARAVEMRKKFYPRSQW